MALNRSTHRIFKRKAAAGRSVVVLLQPAGSTEKRGLKDRRIINKKKSSMTPMFQPRGIRSMADERYIIFPGCVFLCFLLIQICFSPVMEQLACGA